jgi:hypothetical protein
VTKERDERLEPDGVSRRAVLRTMGIAGAALAAGPAFLSACGGDNSGTSSGATTTAATAAARPRAPAAVAACGGDVGTQLASMLKIDAATSGKGMPFKMGSVLALTGSGSFYGKTMSRGIDLALEHIKAAGGPDIQVKY